MWYLCWALDASPAFLKVMWALRSAPLMTSTTFETGPIVSKSSCTYEYHNTAGEQPLTFMSCWVTEDCRFATTIFEPGSFGAAAAAEAALVNGFEMEDRAASLIVKAGSPGQKQTVLW